MAFAAMVRTNPTSPTVKENVGTLSTSDDVGDGGATDGVAKGTADMVSTVLSSENGANVSHICKGGNLNSSFTLIRAK